MKFLIQLGIEVEIKTMYIILNDQFSLKIQTTNILRLESFRKRDSKT